MSIEELFKSIHLNVSTFSHNLGKNRPWFYELKKMNKQDPEFHDQTLNNALWHLQHDIMLIIRDLDDKGLDLLYPRLRLIGLVPGKILKTSFNVSTNDYTWMINKVDSDGESSNLFKAQLMMICNTILQYLYEVPN